MRNKTTEEAITDILKQLESVERKQQATEPQPFHPPSEANKHPLHTPSEAEQEQFERTLESYNRDDKMMSLNAAPKKDDESTPPPDANAA